MVKLPKGCVPLEKARFKAGVYFLFLRGELVYIGVSLNGNRRCKNQVQRYDSVFVMPVRIDERFNIERKMIRKYKPAKNIHGVRPKTSEVGDLGFDDMLGVVLDKKIADMFGIAKTLVMARRKFLKIAPAGCVWPHKIYVDQGFEFRNGQKRGNRHPLAGARPGSKRWLKEQSEQQ